MGVDDPLYIKIIADLQIHHPVSVQDAVGVWGYSEGHTRRVIGWMADQQQPPTMRKIPNTSPMKWERI
jgi:hypothetical protein